MNANRAEAAFELLVDISGPLWSAWTRCREPSPVGKVKEKPGH
jgi:hypothetical protein